MEILKIIFIIEPIILENIYLMQEKQQSTKYAQLKIIMIITMPKKHILAKKLKRMKQKKIWIKKDIKHYFLNLSIYQSLLYNDILLLISERFHPSKIFYTLKKFNNFKNNYNKIKNKKIQNKNHLDNIEIKGKKLLRSTHNILIKMILKILLRYLEQRILCKI